MGVLVGQTLEHGIGEPALGPVVLHDDDVASRRRDRRTDGRCVDWLHRIGIDDASCDPVSVEALVCRERFVDRDSSGDDGDSVGL